MKLVIHPNEFDMEIVIVATNEETPDGFVAIDVGREDGYKLAVRKVESNDESTE